MKTMVERNEVLHRYRIKGQSKRQIAEELHISRLTLERGEVDLEGNVEALIYSNGGGKKQGSAWKRLFR